jgi:hypothetical protein
LVVCLPPVARAQFGLVTLPINDPAYVQLAALEHAGCAAARVSVDRPYQVRLIRAALAVARRQPGCAGPVLDALLERFAMHPGDAGSGFRAGGELSLQATGYHNGVFEPLWDNVRPSSEGDQSAVATLQGRLTWGDGDVAAIVADGYATTGYRNNPTITARVFRHTSGVVDFSEAYAAARAGVFTFSLGRAPEAWLGEGTNSQVLTANGPAYNRLAADFHTAHFEGRVIYGVLDNVVMDSAQDGWSSAYGHQTFYRYIAGHSITWRPSTSIELTVGETALLSRGLPTIDLLYVNPLIPYQISSKDTGRTGQDDRIDNKTSFFGVRTRFDRVTAAVELLIDDIQIDPSARAKTPDQLGYVLSLSSPLPVKLPATVQLQYQRVDSYTYMREFYTEVYQQYNVPLGSELGPDADILTIGGDVFTTGWIRLAADLGWWRRGLQRIYERPAQEATGHAGEPFPTNVAGQPVQSAVLGDASIQFLTAVLPITAQITVARITNVNNLPSAATTYAQAQLYASYALHYP